MAPKPKRRLSADASGSTEKRKTPSKTNDEKSSTSPTNTTPTATSRRHTRRSPRDEIVSSEPSLTGTKTLKTPQPAKSTSKSSIKNEKEGVEHPSGHAEAAVKKADINGKANSSKRKSRVESNDKSSLSAVDTPQHHSTHESCKSSISKRNRDDEKTSDSPIAGLKETSNMKQSDDIIDPSSTLLLSKAAPIMDVTVHRLRNFDYHPKPILCIASTVVDAHVTVETDKSVKETVFPDSLIAVSRESGSIELQTIHPKWRTVSVVAGRTDTPITSLAWVTVEELDSSSTRPALVGVNGSDLYVVDFWGTGQLVSKYSCPGGNIFSLQHIFGSLIATGSRDGSIRIYSVAAKRHCESNRNRTLFQFQPVSTISSAGEAVLSLACIVPRANDNSLKGTVVFAGIADGTIRRYECYQSNSFVSSSATARATAHFSSSAGVLWKSTLRMTVECYGRTTPTRVWAMKALSDGTLVSGDSLGHVQFWDGFTGTLICSFDQNDNKADVLALDVASNECKVFASGVDSRVVCIERRSNVEAPLNNASTQWIMTHAQRPHTHDVKAIAILKKFKVIQSGKVLKETEIMFTGGIDTKLCTYHVSEFGLRRPRVLYPWPSLRSPIMVANEVRLLTMLREDHIDLYELASAPKSPAQLTGPIVAPEEKSMIGTIHIKGSSNLAFSAISSCGKYLALSDTYSVFLFHIKINTIKGGKRNVLASRISIQSPGTCSIVAMQFISDGYLVLVFSDDSIQTFTLEQHDDEFTSTMIQKLSHNSKTISPLISSFPVHAIIASKDGLWIATARNKCHHKDGNVDIYRRTSAGFQFWWSLPTLISAVTAFVFLENSGTPFLSVACIDFSWYIFDLAERRLSDWSMQAGYPLSAGKLPTDLAARNDYPIRIGTNPASPSILLIGSFGAIVVINTKEEFPKRCRIFPVVHVRGTKRKRSHSSSEPTNIDECTKTEKSTSCTMCLRYNSMLFMNCIHENEMVVVEQPWLNVVATFPGSLQRKIYGT